MERRPSQRAHDEQFFIRRNAGARCPGRLGSSRAGDGSFDEAAEGRGLLEAGEIPHAREHVQARAGDRLGVEFQ
jgi:hypothetical protein